MSADAPGATFGVEARTSGIPVGPTEQSVTEVGPRVQARDNSDSTEINSNTDDIRQMLARVLQQQAAATVAAEALQDQMHEFRNQYAMGRSPDNFMQMMSEVRQQQAEGRKRQAEDRTAMLSELRSQQAAAKVSHGTVPDLLHEWDRIMGRSPRSFLHEYNARFNRCSSPLHATPCHSSLRSQRPLEAMKLEPEIVAGEGYNQTHSGTPLAPAGAVQHHDTRRPHSECQVNSNTADRVQSCNGPRDLEAVPSGNQESSEHCTPTETVIETIVAITTTSAHIVTTTTTPAQPVAAVEEVPSSQLPSVVEANEAVIERSEQHMTHILLAEKETAALSISSVSATAHCRQPQRLIAARQWCAKTDALAVASVAALATEFPYDPGGRCKTFDPGGSRWSVFHRLVLGNSSDTFC